MSDLDRRAGELDRDDPLAAVRARFHVPDDMVYLDGNSLGLMPTAVADRVSRTLHDEWSEGLIASWNDAGWFDLPMRVGDRIAPLVGVGAGEVAVGDSTSVDLFKCLAAALHLRPGRRTVVAEGGNFPTDGYMAQGLADLVPDVTLRWFEPDEHPTERVDDDVAVVMLSHVDYRTARVRAMAEVTAAVHERGALVLWDLSHTTGAVRCDLTAADADLAVGCTYKYLNGGPGAPAFAWAAPRHVEALRQPLSGWIGHASPFAFDRDYAPAPGARRLVCGTPQILSLAALDEALTVWDDVTLDDVWAKSTSLTSLFVEAVEELCAGHGLRLVSPRDAGERGSHVSFDLDRGGFEVMRALAARRIVGDFRAPATLRFGFAPLYVRHADVVHAARQLADVLDTRAWDRDEFRVRGAVT